MAQVAIQVGIVGGTGYTGVELLRLLAGHPAVHINMITSRSEQGMPVSELYPSLRGHVDLAFVEPNIEQLGACDVVFFATPHGVAQSMMAAFNAASGAGGRFVGRFSYTRCGLMGKVVWPNARRSRVGE